jgi:hypothetical protein
MDGHVWEKVSSSEVSATGMRTKTQDLWVCVRCLQSTIVDSGQEPERMKELYSLIPLELDGTTIQEPPIASCDEEVVNTVMNS